MILFTFLDSLVVINRMYKKAGVRMDYHALKLAWANAKCCEALAKINEAN